MTDDASSPVPPLPPSGETGPPALIVDGLACFDEWDTLALARLPVRKNRLRKAMRWRPAQPRG
jgi:hypothetical protein